MAPVGINTTYREAYATQIEAVFAFSGVNIIEAEAHLSFFDINKRPVDDCILSEESGC
jgi:hypothetical protein